MPLVVDTNSYVDVAYADAYLLDTLNTESWFLATEPDKEKALVSATILLDTLCTWSGIKTVDDQDLEFPRDGDIDVPDKIKKAEVEIAFEMVRQSIARFTPSGTELSSLKAGSVKLEWYEADSDPYVVVNNIAKSYLRNYGTCAFGSSSIIQAKLER